MLQCPYPIRLTSMWGKTMRQFSERFSSCRTQQEYTQVGIKIFRFFRTEGSNHFPDRRRIPTCEARHGNPIDFPMLQGEFYGTQCQQARWRGLAPTSSDLSSSAGFFAATKGRGRGEPSVPAFLRDAGAVSPPSCAPRSRPPSCPAGSRRARHLWRSCGRCGAAGAGSCWWP